LSDEKTASADPIVVALAIADAALADRVAVLLAGVSGLRIATADERAEVTIVDGTIGHNPAEADSPLTPREAEVLMLLAEGASNKAIARRLGISVHTAKFHVGQLLDKLDATGRTDAIAHAARRGVLHF
jgi:DNA-binding CsgD family transcriptional regulator